MDISKTYNSPRWSGEISDCSLPMTLDTYNNCSFGCVYCFSQYQRAVGGTAESYLNKDVKCINVQKVKDIFTGKRNSQFREYIDQRKTIQWGGLSDQFDGYERKYGVTLELLKFFKEIDYPICFSTKATWWLDDSRYTDLFRGQKNWNVKFSIITGDAEAARIIEPGVPTPQERIQAIEKFTNLGAGGATLRLRPFIIGVTNKTYKQLIKDSAAAGAEAVTTEFFCLDSRSANVARDHYKTISDYVGHDIVEFYSKHSKGSGYLRLNRKIKEPYVKKMRDLAHSLGMRFYVSDAHFKECSDGTCCCGLSDDWNFSRAYFAEALQIARRNGVVRYSDLEAPICYQFDWYKAEGFNTNSSEKRAKFHGMSMAEYLRYLWNNPKTGQGPFKMFEGVLYPDGYDDDGNLIYKWNQEKTFIEVENGLQG